jgi:hypothetical protein
VPLAEAAETQSVDIYEFRHVCDIWLCLMYLGYILCFINYFLRDRQMWSIAAGPGVAWNAETDSYGENFKVNYPGWIKEFFGPVAIYIRLTRGIGNVGSFCIPLQAARSNEISGCYFISHKIRVIRGCYF